ncbi:MAG: hypothetical protein HF312_10725 [Ignavibacteria bacterium]|jgi:hypothetical protein|nr:hypothetical protein [Ignavibacteria bacterium]MCU7520677.1 hypothetical protein [Ignavibacteria bacterium]HEX2962484.1 hypothetical protein [Ignavibacteriales bacterium]
MNPFSDIPASHRAAPGGYQHDAADRGIHFLIYRLIALCLLAGDFRNPAAAFDGHAANKYFYKFHFPCSGQK